MVAEGAAKLKLYNLMPAEETTEIFLKLSVRILYCCKCYELSIGCVLSYRFVLYFTYIAGISMVTITYD